jgi:hypothetical protein
MEEMAGNEVKCGRSHTFVRLSFIKERRKDQVK